MHRRLVRWMIVVALVGCAATGVIAFLSSRDPVEFASAVGHPARMVDWWSGRRRLGPADRSRVSRRRRGHLWRVRRRRRVARRHDHHGADLGTVTTATPRRTAQLSVRAGVRHRLAARDAVPRRNAARSSDQRFDRGCRRCWWAGLALAVVRIALLCRLRCRARRERRHDRPQHERSARSPWPSGRSSSNGS